MATFITGATGFIGSYLAAAMLAADERLFVHVRCRDREDGFSRFQDALSAASGIPVTGLPDRVTICPGDLTQANLGLSSRDIDQVAEECEHFLHCGADVRFDRDLKQARAVNTQGTGEMLRLARERSVRGRLDRVDIVSTAWVAGPRLGLSPEGRLPRLSQFSNTYEQSKFEAEELAWEAMGDLPICIHRPSIVVGEADSGQTTSFSTLYAPIRIYALGLWRTVPARPEAVLDIVPVDYVRDAILELRKHHDTLGRCFHITAGKDRVIALGEVVSIVEAFFPGRRQIKYADPDRFQRYALPVLSRIPVPRLKLVAQVAGAYLPYMTSNPMFDDSSARKILDPAGIAPPFVRDYVETLLQFAVQANFGR